MTIVLVAAVLLTIALAARVIGRRIAFVEGRCSCGSDLRTVPGEHDRCPECGLS